MAVYYNKEGEGNWKEGAESCVLLDVSAATSNWSWLLEWTSLGDEVVLWELDSTDIRISGGIRRGGVGIVVGVSPLELTTPNIIGKTISANEWTFF